MAEAVHGLPRVGRIFDGAKLLNAVAHCADELDPRTDRKAKEFGGDVPAEDVRRAGAPIQRSAAPTRVSAPGARHTFPALTPAVEVHWGIPSEAFLGSFRIAGCTCVLWVFGSAFITDGPPMENHS